MTSIRDAPRWERARPEASEKQVTREWRRGVQGRLFAVDLLAIVIAVAVAFVARFGRSSVNDLSGAAYFWCAVALAAAWVGSMFASQTYRAECLAVGSDEFRRVGRATFAVFGLFAIVSMIFKLEISRAFLAVALPLGLALLLLGRVIGRVSLNRARGRGENLDRVLVVGAPQEVRYVASRIQANPAAGYSIAGVATGDVNAAEFELADGDIIPQTGRIDNVVQAATQMDVAGVIVAGHARVNRELLRDLSWQLEGSGMTLALTSRMTDVAGPRIHWRPIEGLPLMSVEVPRYSGAKFYLKRVFDFCASLGGLIVLSPFLLALAIAIKMDSPGPVFFRQTRVGVNGKQFKMTKFRSMVVDAEQRLADLKAQSEGNGVLFKMKDDPRITRVGRFIRKYSLDEMPQLFDVLAGSMSLVGPRPPLPSEVEEYEDHVHRRLNVKPGITGPWQVGGRSNLSWEDSVRKDLYYVENWSLAGDIVILLKTVRAVLMRDGAY